MMSTSAGGRSGVAEQPRATKQRRAITEVLEETEEFRTAQEIHDLLKDRGSSVGLSTVYRTLQAMADSGTLDTLRAENGESVFRACSATHHHHLVCRSCGATVEVEGPAVESWATKVAAGHGFRDISHTAEIFGTCENC